LERELKSVLLPTFGRPTMPHEKPMGGPPHSVERRAVPVRNSTRRSARV
jgi:hypothetical protein